ncbi:hypothetical protein [Effusibacillus dendaii]|uniref:Uncharacterized protein n=1 Tax=Effusibacillus dendaii TaxID=2743772 RepID=A0A7I8DAQ1_9BACL|nr:hypothetical protein [Effusibacillus dendaii]BCJ87268.1 hypothetical protein skT53_22530 [Effusibacillus dendaii]
MGETQGFAKAGNIYEYHGNRKSVFVKVLDPHFRNVLGVMPDPRPLYVRKTVQKEETRMLLSKPDYDPHILEQCGIHDEEVSMVSDMLEQYLEPYRPSYKRNIWYSRKHSCSSSSV